MATKTQARPPARPSRRPAPAAPKPPQQTRQPAAQAQRPAQRPNPPAAAPRQAVVPHQQRAAAVADDVETRLATLEMQHAGLGVSTLPRDNITPSVKLLQPLSPEVVDKEVEGAEGGDLVFSGLGLVSGRTGYWCQPCGMTEVFFEFIPRDEGGGFVASYPVHYDESGELILPDGASRDEDNPNKITFENGNNCTHYRHVPMILWNICGDDERGLDRHELLGMEYVIPFFSTGHTVAKQWNTAWTRKRWANGGIRPAFSHVYQLTTFKKSNKHGTWFLHSMSEGVPLARAVEIVGDPERAYNMGHALASAFASGEKQPEVTEESGASETGPADESGDPRDRDDEKSPY